MVVVSRRVHTGLRAQKLVVHARELLANDVANRRYFLRRHGAHHLKRINRNDKLIGTKYTCDFSGSGRREQRYK